MIKVEILPTPSEEDSLLSFSTNGNLEEIDELYEFLATKEAVAISWFDSNTFEVLYRGKKRET